MKAIKRILFTILIVSCLVMIFPNADNNIIQAKTKQISLENYTSSATLLHSWSITAGTVSQESTTSIEIEEQSLICINVENPDGSDDGLFDIQFWVDIEMQYSTQVYLNKTSTQATTELLAGSYTLKIIFVPDNSWGGTDADNGGTDSIDIYLENDLFSIELGNEINDFVVSQDKAITNNQFTHYFETDENITLVGIPLSDTNGSGYFDLKIDGISRIGCWRADHGKWYQMISTNVSEGEHTFTVDFWDIDPQDNFGDFYISIYINNLFKPKGEGLVEGLRIFYEVIPFIPTEINGIKYCPSLITTKYVHSNGAGGGIAELDYYNTITMFLTPNLPFGLMHFKVPDEVFSLNYSTYEIEDLGLVDPDGKGCSTLYLYSSDLNSAPSKGSEIYDDIISVDSSFTHTFNYDFGDGGNFNVLGLPIDNTNSGLLFVKIDDEYIAGFRCVDYDDSYHTIYFSINSGFHEVTLEYWDDNYTGYDGTFNVKLYFDEIKITNQFGFSFGFFFNTAILITFYLLVKNNHKRKNQ
ncbi:MAG: hypothetical protein ACTSSK_12530 [Candidatus Heimdallarchaeota archaeon]